MKKVILNILFFGYYCVHSQTIMMNSFYGDSIPAAELCPTSEEAFTDMKVNKLIDDILSIYNLKNRFITIPCASIPNCQAVYFEAKPYILYNSLFLEEVKRLNFSEKEIVTNDRNWEVLTILAHELGHHFYNQLNSPPPAASNQSLELEADEYAGMVIYVLGGNLSQAQLAYRNLAENPTYTHPGKNDPFDAIIRGLKNGDSRSTKGRMLVVSNNEPLAPEKKSVIFKSVVIEDQIWMAENLNVDHFLNGVLVPEIQDADSFR